MRPHAESTRRENRTTKAFVRRTAFAVRPHHQALSVDGRPRTVRKRPVSDRAEQISRQRAVGSAKDAQPARRYLAKRRAIAREEQRGWGHPSVSVHPRQHRRRRQCGFRADVFARRVLFWMCGAPCAWALAIINQAINLGANVMLQCACNAHSLALPPSAHVSHPEAQPIFHTRNSTQPQLYSALFVFRRRSGRRRLALGRPTTLGRHSPGGEKMPDSYST
jgi:hypothetical protein